MNDQNIIALIRTGDSNEALNALYRHFPSVRKMVLANGGSVNDAEDVFQDALIILIRKVRATDFKLTAQLSTYLFSVCKYVWKDELKKQNRLIVDDLTSDVGNIEQPEMAEAIAHENKAKLAEQVLSELKERCRELLLLFYHSGMSLRDIAAKMRYNSENTAKNQKYKCLEWAKIRLRELQQTLSTF